MGKRFPALAAAVFFVGLLCLGLVVFDDYGVAWDEGDQRAYGEAVYDYVFHGDQRLLTHRERYHGPGFELFLVLVERALHIPDSRSVHLMRHLLTFLTFYLGVISFYFLCRRYFGSSLYGLAGSVLLVTSPLIFAHAFFNSKDIPALSLFALSIYTLFRFEEQGSWINALLHAAASALLMSVRITGVMIPVLTVVVWLLPAGRRSRQWRVLFFFLITWSLLTVMLWPTLWKEPLREFANAFREMSSYPWTGKTFYWGRYFGNKELPWHYAPLWIAISTPLAYSAGALFGLLTLLRKGVRKRLADVRDVQQVVILSWFLLPLLSVILLRSVIYDTWRHLFFIYPAFLMIAMEGFRQVQRSLPAQGRLGLALKVMIWGILVHALLSTGLFMSRNHPLQHVYFSLPRAWVASRFELDYWGLSYRQALEKLLAMDPAPVIPIKVANLPGALNVGILPAADRQRIHLVGDPKAEAKYFLTNMRYFYTQPYAYPQVFSIETGGVTILKIFSVSPRLRP